MAAAICHSKGAIQQLKDGACKCKDECKSRDIDCGPVRLCVWNPKTCTGECGKCNNSTTFKKKPGDFKIPVFI